MRKLFVFLHLMLLMLFSIQAIAAQSPQEDVRWHHPMYLSNNNYWKKRVIVPVSEISGTEDYQNIYLQIGKEGLDIDITKAESIRVCTSNGIELAYSCSSKDKTPIKTGPLGKDSYLIIPADTNTGAVEYYYIYYDNPTAGETRQCIIYEWEDIPANNSKLINYEEMIYQDIINEGINKGFDLEETGCTGIWYKNPENSQQIWNFRVPVKIINTTDNEYKSQLTAVKLMRFTNWLQKRINIMSIRILDGDTSLPLKFHQMDELTVFLTDVKSKSIKTLYVYFSEDPNINLLESLYYSKEEIIAYPGNDIVENPSFENVTDYMPDNWQFSNGSLCLEGVVNSTPIGDKCAGIQYLPLVDIPPYVGWNQTVDVDPEKMYFFGYYSNSEPDTDKYGVYLDYYNTTGIDKTPAYYKPNDFIGRFVEENGSWQARSEVICTPSDVDQMKINLTFNGSGTIYHDGIIFAETLYGESEDMELNPVLDTGNELTMWEVNTIEKVFPDSPPPQIINPDIFLYAAGNEKESFQIALKSKTTGPVTINLRELTLLEASYDKLNDITINEIIYVPIDAITKSYRMSTKLKDHHRHYPNASDGIIVPPSLDSGNDGWTGMWPDPIVEYDSSLELNAGETKSLWVTVNVPDGTASGLYTGKIEVSADTGLIASLNIIFKVWNFDLPQETELTNIFDVDSIYDPRKIYIKNSFTKILEDEGSTSMDLRLYYKRIWEMMSTQRLNPNRIYTEPEFTYKGENHPDNIVNFAGYDIGSEYYFNVNRAC